jgi:hypothetical protein
MWNLAAAFCLLVFSAQTASAGWMAGANSIERGMIVRIDWQYPWQLPPRFRNHCAYEYFTARALRTSGWHVLHEFHLPRGDQ